MKYTQLPNPIRTKNQYGMTPEELNKFELALRLELRLMAKGSHAKRINRWLHKLRMIPFSDKLLDMKQVKCYKNKAA